MSEFTPGETMEGSGGFRSFDDWGELGEPRKLGNWILGDSLGAGGWGVVYEARHELWEEVVAVKVLRPALAAVTGNPKAFLREANALRALRGCESIVEVRDVGNLEGYHYMVMELAEGLEVAGERMLSLAHWMERKGQSGDEMFSLAEVLRVGLDVLAALRMAHEQGVIHRDVKPANILLTAQGRAKLADFGLVKLIDAELAEIRNGTKALEQGSQTGVAIKGTLSYMSPEQEEARPIDERSDLYSLGVVLYQMVTGMLPKGRFKLPGEMGMGFLAELDDLLDKALQPYPDLRYQHAVEMAEELTQVEVRASAEAEARKKEEQEEVARQLREEEERKNAERKILIEQERVRQEEQKKKERELVKQAIEASQKKKEEDEKRERAERRNAKREGIGSLKKGLIVGAALVGMTFFCSLFVVFGDKGEEEEKALIKEQRSLRNVSGGQPPVRTAKPIREGERKLSPLEGIYAGEERNFEIAPGVKMTMCWCPATTSEEWKKLISGGKDTFTMGSPEDEEGRGDNENEYEVKLTRGFWLGKHEVTQGQWEAVMGTSVTDQRDKMNPDWPLIGDGKNYPIYYVSWEESVAFAKKLRRIEDSNWEWGLPSEAEWEYGCRAGGESKWSHGDKESELSDYAWYGESSGEGTHEVGGKKANKWGLHDMHGNVWEWCRDWYGVGYDDLSQIDPGGPSVGPGRVYRGGCWSYSADFNRSSYRYWFSPSLRIFTLGFRVSLQVSADKKAKQASSESKEKEESEEELKVDLEEPDPVVEKKSSPWKTIEIGGNNYVTVKSIKEFYGFEAMRIVEKELILEKANVRIKCAIGEQSIWMNEIKFILAHPVILFADEPLIHRVDLVKLIDPVMRPYSAKRESVRIDTVIIDPGHGGKDAGNISPHGDGKEKDHTLSVAKKLSNQLRKRGFKVGLTRSSDKFLSVQSRVDFANQYPNAVFVSLHFNSSDDAEEHGIETFSLSPQGVPDKDFGLKSSDFKENLGNKNDAFNIALATAVHSTVIENTGRVDRGIRRARYSVLSDVKHPAILIEGGFLTHSKDGGMIKREDYQDRLALSIAEAVVKYKMATERKPQVVKEDE